MEKELILQESDIYKGPLRLINKSYPIHEDENMAGLKLLSVRSDENVLLEAKTASVLDALLSSIDARGRIAAVSGYRSKEEQTNIYEGSLAENGEAFTRQYVAVPGASEHQSGLAIDVGERLDTIDFICPSFPETGICGKFYANAATYGFIKRYEQGKEDITGISHEPWHFRYVGYPHAKIMKDMGFCLEEYISFIKGFASAQNCLSISEDGQETGVWYVAADSERTVITIPEGCLFQVSGNNIDGFIMTCWK